MFELRTFSADWKFVELFHVPVVEFEFEAYTISNAYLHWNSKCALPKI